MNENKTNYLPEDNNPNFVEEMNNQRTDINRVPSPSNLKDGNKPRDGFSFNLLNLVLGVAIFSWMINGGNLLTDDWTYYFYLCIAVIIHELGHVIVGKSFGCFIKEMQVFFLPFVSYKPKHISKGNSWRDIKWSLGTIPLGGCTMFKSRESKAEVGVDSMEAETPGMEMRSTPSPYIEDKPAWQRLLISAAGVLFNFATFIILYIAMPNMSFEWHCIFQPLAALSLLLAALNILPIYPLDGGAIVFALFEIITGKKPSPRVTKVCGWIGFIIIVLFFWVFPEWLDGILNSVFGLFF